MKPVISGFFGDDDRLYKLQNTHRVLQSVDTIDALIEEAETVKE
jgi:hypothetical protein